MGTVMEAQNGYAVEKLEIGSVIVGYRDGKVAAILLGDATADVRRQLDERFPDIALSGPCRDSHGVARKLAASILGEDLHFDIPVDVAGTPFQKAVWNAIRSIPHGRTETYAQIAEKIGHPKSVRAVASACGANPLAVFTPCHRVVRADGKSTGYAWGMDRKRAILQLERQARRQNYSGTPHV